MILFITGSTLQPLKNGVLKSVNLGLNSARYQNLSLSFFKTGHFHRFCDSKSTFLRIHGRRSMRSELVQFSSSLQNTPAAAHCPFAISPSNTDCCRRTRYPRGSSFTFVTAALPPFIPSFSNTDQALVPHIHNGQYLIDNRVPHSIYSKHVPKLRSKLSKI